MVVSRLIAACVLALAMASAAAAQQMKIQVAEPVSLAAESGHVEFVAYGRRFSLRLESNQRALAKLPAARKAELVGIRLLRGAVDGVPGSWVRLIESGGQYEGAIWDGSDLYSITRYEKIAPHLGAPLGVAPDATFVYRLSDTTNALPDGFCAVEDSAPPANDGLSQYRKLLGEIRQQAAAAVVSDQLEISIIADSTLQARFASSPGDLQRTLLAAFNVTEGIFDSQVNLLLVAGEYRYLDAAEDPFTSNNPSTLLGQLSTYRRATPAVSAMGLAHLFSGRTPDSNIVGIARLGGVCDVDDGVSLTIEQNGSSSIDALIMAHEIAHNLGAEHDTPACGQNLLMSAELTSSSTLSQCALDAMRPVIQQARGRCVTPALYADAAIAIDTSGPEKINGEPFDFFVVPRSVGTAALTDVTVTVGALLFVTINSATVPGGTCTSTSSGVTCTLPSIAAGEEPRIEINATAPFARPFDVMAQVSAANDRYGNNNSAAGVLDILAAADVAVSISASSTAVNTGDPIDFTVTVSALRVRPVQGVSVNLYGDSSLYFQYVSITPATGCSIFPINIGCTIGTLNPGESRQFVLRAIPRQGGTGRITATLSASNDSNGRNDQATTPLLSVTALRDAGFDLGATFRLVPVGAPTDLNFAVRSAGLLPINNVLVTLYPGSDDGAVKSVDIDGVDCVWTNVWTCVIDTMNAGTQRNLRVRALFTEQHQPGYGANMAFRLTADDDAFGSNNNGSVLVVARYAVDVSLGTPSTSAVFEGQTARVTSAIYSVGIEASTNVSVTLDVPAPAEVVSGTLEQGSCVVTNARRLTCTRASLPVGIAAQIAVDVRSAVPGSVVGRFTVTAANDGIPDNNIFDTAILFRPLTDVGIRPVPPLPAFILGQSYAVSFQVFTGAHPVDWVDVLLPFFANQVAVDSVTTTSGSCPAPSSGSNWCHLGALPANALVTITMNLRPLVANGVVNEFLVMAQTSIDSNHDNDLQRVRYSTNVPGDVQAAVAQATVSAASGSSLTLPRITLNTILHGDDLFVEIPIPSFASVESVASASGFCQGTTVISCYFPARDPGAADFVDVTLRLNQAGTFVSNIRGGARNDINPANDSVALTITSNAVTTPTPPPSNPPGSSGGGGGGGGGRIEWLLLALLGGLAARRIGIRPATRVPDNYLTS